MVASGARCAQVSIEFDVEDAAAVGATAEARKSRVRTAAPNAHRGRQTVARLQSPEGAIVGISYIPMFHDEN